MALLTVRALVACGLATGLVGLPDVAGADEPTASGDDMLPAEVLHANEAITSRSGRYSLVYQADGNVVVYRNNPGRDRDALWSSHTAGSSPGVLAMQPDGNLVVYSARGPGWASGTVGGSSRLVMQDDGNAVLYRGDAAMWATNTAPRPSPPQHTRQKAGDLTAGVPKKFASQWGLSGVVPPKPLSLKYAVDIQGKDGQPVRGATFKCYADGLKVHSGPLPGTVTVTSFPYGECWFTSPVNATYRAVPLSG